MRKLIVCWVLALLSGGMAAAAVRVVVTPAADPGPALVTSAPRPHAKADTGPSDWLWLPFFEVDARNPAGVTTLFAVRNRGTQAVNVHYYYVPVNLSSPSVVRTGTLAPRQTQTINIRDVAGIPTDPATGFKRGYVLIRTDDQSQTLMGDFFRVDPTNNFAGGDALVSPVRSCLFWDSRFLNGGPFTGGTTFTFLLGMNDSGGTTPIVIGRVYDEPGSFRGTVQIFTRDTAFEVNTAQLNAAVLGSSGTIEWAVQQPDLRTFVLATHRAAGRYAVAVPSMCADALVQ